MNALLLPFVLLAMQAIFPSTLDAPADLAQAVRAADGAYQVPYASTGNRLELAVANPGTAASGPVEVTAAEVPPWLTLTPPAVTLDALAAGAEGLAAFTFDVGETAPVERTHRLVLDVRTPAGVTFQKEIRLRVEAPREVMLHASYPNPFNPSTTIGYTLPMPGKASLRIYNMLGQEVAVLVDAPQAAGYHTARWEAGSFASGLYLYRLVVTDEAGAYTARQGRMLLLK